MVINIVHTDRSNKKAETVILTSFISIILLCSELPTASFFSEPHNLVSLLARKLSIASVARSMGVDTLSYFRKNSRKYRRD
jgi:hypothetical protein